MKIVIVSIIAALITFNASAQSDEKLIAEVGRVERALEAQPQVTGGKFLSFDQDLGDADFIVPAALRGYRMLGYQLPKAPVEVLVKRVERNCHPVNALCIGQIFLSLK